MKRCNSNATNIFNPKIMKVNYKYFKIYYLVSQYSIQSEN
jgi:hypothetical protein